MWRNWSLIIKYWANFIHYQCQRIQLAYKDYHRHRGNQLTAGSTHITKHNKLVEIMRRLKTLKTWPCKEIFQHYSCIRVELHDVGLPAYDWLYTYTQEDCIVIPGPSIHIGRQTHLVFVHYRNIQIKRSTQCWKRRICYNSRTGCKFTW